MAQASLFDDAPDDETVAAPVAPCLAVAAGAPSGHKVRRCDGENVAVADATLATWIGGHDQGSRERFEATYGDGQGPQSRLPLPAEKAENPYFPTTGMSAYEAQQQEAWLEADAAGDEGDADASDDEQLEDVLLDTDWSLGSATGRYKAIATGGQMNNNRTRAAKDAAAEELRTGKTQQFQAGRVDDREETNHLSKRVNASVRAISSGLDKERVRRKDKADRATVEQVIDPRTRMILFKLLKNDYIQEIYGTISTGKEANVYHSVGGLTLEMLNRGEKLQAGGARHAAPQRHGGQLNGAQQEKADEMLAKAAQDERMARLRLRELAEPEPEPEPEQQPEPGGISAAELELDAVLQELEAEDDAEKTTAETERWKASQLKARNFLNGASSSVQMKGNDVRDEDSVNELAIKIFKTSILVFKDRDKYVSGDYRFRGGYSKHNPRKMVKAWAEKEFRNLSRLHEAKIRCPRPRMLRNHVLLMDFIGQGGVAAPRLKDCEMDAEQAHVAYLECVKMMWRMYNEAKLVHGDLSEYNILYWRNECVFIDVSQSVEHDHPSAFDFLRKDCENICAFFHKKGCLSVMTLRELFDFITDTAITTENYVDYLEKMMDICSERPAPTARQMVADAVFKEAFIPTRLADINHYERELTKVSAVAAPPRVTATSQAYDDLLGASDTGRHSEAVADDDYMYRKVIGVNPESQSARLKPELLDGGGDGGGGDGDGDSGSGSEEEREWEDRTPAPGVDKHEHKKKIKAEQAARRVKKKQEGRGKLVKKRAKIVSHRH